MVVKSDSVTMKTMILTHADPPKVSVRERLDMRDRMLAIFQAAAKERPQRNDLLPVPGGKSYEREFGWVVFERETMWAAVNKERDARGLKPVSLLVVQKVEQFATGHSDYASKFALYSAELAVGDIEVEP